MRLNSTGVKYHNDIITSGKLIISNNGTIDIGKGVVINSGSYPNPVGVAETRIYTYDKNSCISIGDYSGMSNVLLFAKESIHIGNGVMIGADTKIIDNDFHGVNNRITPEGKYVRDEGKSAPVYIGNGVFIGMNCLILKGVKIGENSVIGAGSVVTHDIPANEIWAGNPAKLVGKNK